MKLFENYSEDYVSVSVEVFPPKDDVDGSKLVKLTNNLQVLKQHNPTFVSLTYGANGSSRDSSLSLISHIKENLNIDVMPHFTCVNTSRETVLNYIKDIENLGIKNILALRGDIPQGVTQSNFDFKYASELLRFIREVSKDDFSIGVAGYPETHIEASSPEEDLAHLKEKVDCGADAIFTQLFFDNDKFYRFVEKVRKFTDIPIVAGIMPVISKKQIDRMIAMSNVFIPQRLSELLNLYEESEVIKRIGVDFSTKQCNDLLNHGVKCLHFFTLNTARATDAILNNLGL